ncbi:hypothetical protein MAA_11721 [Metarhizium robertsii ARSEF 23]|uniref:Uncharacterized protein n=1 Tax=Metarhizium robertsii (strain ARSEF 23 / ATCC MYA-3075) TaxID=655844 RepID=A0A0B2XD86_METRA|nr:uncharacterized protein MAA_11721 [Metarhizium robertsii ARSEF 23]KHO10670.1 hypothetical protein MAA_11721 [Metarhizium robertsii ARSEF 23]
MSSGWQVSTPASFAQEQDRAASRRGSPSIGPLSEPETTARFKLQLPSEEAWEEYLSSGTEAEQRAREFFFRIPPSSIPTVTVTSICSDFYATAASHGNELVKNLNQALALSNGRESPEVVKLRMVIRVFRQVLVGAGEVLVRIVVNNCSDSRDPQIRNIVDFIDNQMGACQRLYPVESYGPNTSRWQRLFCVNRRQWFRNGINFDELGSVRLGSWAYVLYILMKNYSSISQYFTRDWCDNFFDQEEPICPPKITANCQCLSLINVLFRILGPALGPLQMGYDQYELFYKLLVRDVLVYTLRHSDFRDWVRQAPPPPIQNPSIPVTTDWPFRFFSLQGNDELRVSIRQRLHNLRAETKSLLPRFDGSALKRGLKTYPLPDNEEGLIRDIWEVMRDKIRRWMASHGEESEDLSDSATHPSKWPVIDRLEPRAALRWASGYAYLSIPLTFDKEQDVVLIKGANAKTEKCGPYTVLATLKGVSFRIGSDFLLIPVVTLQRS